MQKQYSKKFKRCTVFSGRSTVPVLRPSSCSHTPSCRYTQSDSQGAAGGDAACSASLLWPLVRHTDRVSREGTAIGRVCPSVCFHTVFWTKWPFAIGVASYGASAPSTSSNLFFMLHFVAIKVWRQSLVSNVFKILRSMVIKISSFFILLKKLKGYIGFLCKTV